MVHPLLLCDIVSDADRDQSQFGLLNAWKTKTKRWWRWGSQSLLFNNLIVLLTCDDGGHEYSKRQARQHKLKQRLTVAPAPRHTETTHLGAQLRHASANTFEAVNSG